MIQTIKSEYGFDSEGRNLKISSKMAVSYVPKTYFTKNLDINILILTFYGCLEA